MSIIMTSVFKHNFSLYIDAPINTFLISCVYIFIFFLFFVFRSCEDMAIGTIIPHVCGVLHGIMGESLGENPGHSFMATGPKSI